MSINHLTDVHAHLADAAFDADRSEVLARARAVGVGAVVTVGETLSDARKILALADVHPEILPAAGLYPNRLCAPDSLLAGLSFLPQPASCLEHTESKTQPASCLGQTSLGLAQADEIISFIRQHRHRIVAIGEVGLDHWKVQDDEGRKLQREIFSRFIDLSLELDLPLNVHSRSAGRAAIELLLEKGAKRVLLHAFDAKASAALPAVEAGYFFSIPPSVVRSEQKRKLVKALPLSAILLETDSPVLGAVPGERNEPANLIIALKAVAEIKGLGEEAVREAVLLNQAEFFKV